MPRAGIETGYAVIAPTDALVFGSAFLAATVLPFYSEITVAAALAAGHDAARVFFFATLGNTLGAAVNWVMGRFLARFQERTWFPFRGPGLERAQRWFQRWGKWTLLLAWAPVGGDALTFIAGVMRVSFPVFFILTLIGKGARYLVLIYLLENMGAYVAG